MSEHNPHPRRCVPKSLCLLAAVIVAATSATVPLIGQEDASLTLQKGAAENPFKSEADVEAGARVFRSSCVLCHGGDAKGGRGPDLTRGAFRHGSSDAALFRTIRLGIPGTDMVGAYLPDSEIWRVVSYVRSLSEGAEAAELPGDPQRGAQIYASRGGCSECHRVSGDGGRLGPDLTDVGWLRSPEYLEKSLLRPGEDLHPRYRTVRVVTREGREIRGVLRNEDTYSVLMLDENENLRAFSKADLLKVEKPQESLMPDFSTFFSEPDRQHLVAYLYSLKGESR